MFTFLCVAGALIATFLVLVIGIIVGVAIALERIKKLEADLEEAVKANAELSLRLMEATGLVQLGTSLNQIATKCLRSLREENETKTSLLTRWTKAVDSEDVDIVTDEGDALLDVTHDALKPVDLAEDEDEDDFEYEEEVPTQDPSLN